MTDTNNPNYLQPPDYSAQRQRPNCKHENIMPSEANDKNIYPYRCANAECDAKFPEVCVEMADGKLRQVSFAVKRGKRSARRRSGL